MTAAAGLVHSEMPEKEFARIGRPLHGLQLWVNLPRKDKMIKPRYQDIPSSKIPVAKTDDGKVQVKVIAGEALGEHAVVDTRTQIMYLHYILKLGAEIIQPLPKDYNIFAYVINGKGTFGKIIKWLREVSLSSSKMMIIRYLSKKGRLEITNRCHH